MKEIKLIIFLLLLLPIVSLYLGITSPTIAKQSSLILPILNSKDPSNVTVTILLGSGSNTRSPGYSPQNITVVIGLNNTVVWLNNDTAHHTVSSSSGVFNSGDMAPGQKYSFTFDQPGKYDYYCAYHAWMHGTVTVTQPIPEFPNAIPILLSTLTIVAVIFGLLRFKATRIFRQIKAV